MQVVSYKTNKIKSGENLFHILDKYLPKLEEKSVVVITSKIISICQGRVVKNNSRINKTKLVEQEADLYLPQEVSRYRLNIAIKNHILSVNAGIDESNAGGYFILWPENLQETTNKIWRYLKQKHQLKNLGIVVSDSRTLPLRWGVVCIGLSWCGIKPLNDYIGKPDIYGRLMHFTKVNIVDELATAAGLVMGEGNEQTPLAVITELPNLKFQNQSPTNAEIKSTHIELEDDMYAPFLTAVKWKKGKRKLKP